MTSQQFLVCDASTLANFKQWAQGISGFFATAGWVQTSDTGQVNWSTISTIPGSGVYVYEIWKPGDALTPYYVKMEYGNVSGSANSPGLRLTVSTATDGAGNPTLFIMGPYRTTVATYTTPSATTQYECDFSGDSGSIRGMMWRNGINACQQFFAISRSVDGTGARTGAYVTMALAGYWNGTASSTATQQSLVFGRGPAPGWISQPNGGGTGNNSGWGVRPGSSSTGVSGGGAFAGSIPLDLIAPLVGYFDYPCPDVGVAFNNDLQEGVTFTATVYGATRTYLPSKASFLTQVGACGAPAILCMRFD